MSATIISLPSPFIFANCARPAIGWRYLWSVWRLYGRNGRKLPVEAESCGQATVTRPKMTSRKTMSTIAIKIRATVAATPASRSKPRRLATAVIMRRMRINLIILGLRRAFLPKHVASKKGSRDVLWVLVFLHGVVPKPVHTFGRRALAEMPGRKLCSGRRNRRHVPDFARQHRPESLDGHSVPLEGFEKLGTRLLDRLIGELE